MLSLLIFFLKKTIRRTISGVMTKEMKMKIKKLLYVNAKMMTVVEKNRKEKAITVIMMLVTSPVMEEIK
jgi:hypothetical protein